MKNKPDLIDGHNRLGRENRFKSRKDEEKNTIG